MKRFLPAICILLLLAAPGRASATSKEYKAAPVRLNSIKMVSAAVGWAMAGSTVLRTTNGGVSWLVVLGCAGQREIAGAFLSSQVARLAVVNGAAPYSSPITVYRTSNGGRSWQSAHLSAKGEVGPGDRLTFSDANHGWLFVNRGVGAGQNPYILLRTVDGGSHWKVLARTDQPNQKPNVIPGCDCTTAITFKNPTTGWATGTGFAVPNPVWLYVTRDGGQNWHEHHLPVPSGFAVVLETFRPSFFGGRLGVMGAQLMKSKGTSNGFVTYVTRDGGTRWNPGQTIVIPAGQGYGLTASFADISHGWVASGKSIARTTDSGKHWTFLHPNAAFTRVTLIDFVRPSIGFALSEANRGYGLLKTTDGGMTWHTIRPSSAGILFTTC